MQPYVVAVLINAVANPLGVGSFILSLSPPPPPSLSLSLPLSLVFLFAVHRDLLSLFFLNFISEQQTDYMEQAESLFGITKARKNCRKCEK